MDGNPGTHNYDVYIDDVYVDSTPARVEVCKESTWATRKHCEIQPATAWGTSSITIVANAGTLDAGTNYLYVVDSANTANTNGVGVTVGNGADTTAPSRSAGAPSGSLSSGTITTTMSLTTDEAATCKYSTTVGVAYASMAGTFTTTGGASHSVTVSGLSNGGSYSRYIRCADDESNPNVNTDDYTISWTVSSGNSGRAVSGGANLHSGGGSFR